MSVHFHNIPVIHGSKTYLIESSLSSHKKKECKTGLFLPPITATSSKRYIQPSLLIIMIIIYQYFYLNKLLMMLKSSTVHSKSLPLSPITEYFLMPQEFQVWLFLFNEFKNHILLFISFFLKSLNSLVTDKREKYSYTLFRNEVYVRHLV